jgi:hypothetical protein
LLHDIGEAGTSTFASQVRRALAEDNRRVHAHLAGLRDIEFAGASATRPRPMAGLAASASSRHQARSRRTSSCRRWAPHGTRSSATWILSLGTGHSRPAR